MTAIEPALSSSQQMSTRSTPMARMMVRLCRKISVA
jgi:hypothetical protein